MYSGGPQGFEVTGILDLEHYLARQRYRISPRGSGVDRK